MAMTMLSIRFSKALSGGRHLGSADKSREQLLATLLRKRATASTIGADELEALLRAQILWSLPVRRQIADTEPELAEAS